MFSALPIYQCVREEKLASTGKIFRPWDAKEVQSSKVQEIKQERPLPLPLPHHQDATVTTTTKEFASTSTPEPSSESSQERLYETYEQFHPSSRTIPSIAMYPSGYLPSLPSISEYLPLPGLSPDMLLNQNYALEEYARVLSQDHQAKLLSSRKQRPKKYKCPHCEVGFSNNGQLKGHIRIHTGERPFKCDEKNCGKTFTRNEELTRHKRIHSGLRPFPCPQCGKRFGRKDHLKKHSRTHMQPRSGVYAVPIMLPLDTWASASYPYMASVPLLY